MLHNYVALLSFTSWENNHCKTITLTQIYYPAKTTKISSTKFENKVKTYLEKACLIWTRNLL